MIGVFVAVVWLVWFKNVLSFRPPMRLRKHQNIYARKATTDFVVAGTDERGKYEGRLLVGEHNRIDIIADMGDQRDIMFQLDTGTSITYVVSEHFTIKLFD